MSDYYIQSINKTFFLSGSLIYHTNNSGSNVNKSNSEVINLEYILEALENDDGNPTITNFVNMANEVSGSNLYFKDKGLF
tara:strand:- start:170 stop:409 length:240 start_codon:yes stop_codon:yes gene_type:complete